MNRIISVLILASISFTVSAQNRMTPELLWQLGRAGAIGISRDGKQLVYSVSTPSISENKSTSKRYSIPLTGGVPYELSDEVLVDDKTISPDGQYQITVQDVKVNKVQGKEFYPELDKSNVQIYDGLNYRHWDTWEDGSYSHLFVHPIVKNKRGEGKDVMANAPYDCPQMPF